MKLRILTVAVMLVAPTLHAQPSAGAWATANGEHKMDDLGAQIGTKAKLAVAQLNEQANGRLDYSERSLQAVEELLAEASPYASEMDSANRKALVELLGSYILEVAFRAHGGTFYWDKKRDQPVLVAGEPTFHVGIMTFDKVNGRLAGDKADNIPFFYEGFAARVKSAAPGTNAVYL